MHYSGTKARTLLRAFTVAAGMSAIPAARCDNTEVPRLFEQTGGNDQGPCGEPKAEFDAFLTNTPNITGQYPIAGYDISTPYVSNPEPGDDTIDGWLWSIAVAADLPLENSTTMHSDDDFYTGGRIVLEAPKSLVSDGGNLTVDDEWKLCVFAWNVGDNESYPEDLRNDNGTCGSILSDECIANLKTEATPALGEGGGQCSCPNIDIIQGCGNDDDATSAFGNGCYARSFNATELRQSGLWDNGQLEIYSFGEATTHKSGNRTAYDNIGSLAWPVMIWMGTSGMQFDLSLTCVRATDPVDGSTEPASLGSVNPLDSSLTLAGMMAILACVAVM